MKTLKRTLIIIIIAIAFYLPLKISAINIPALEKEGFITYKLHHKLHNIAATSKAIKCIVSYDPVKDQINSVTAVADVTTFDSGNGNLDSHAMEVVEALKYPKVMFKSTNIVDSGNSLSVTGFLTFHGVSKEIFFTANKIRKGNAIDIDGNLPLSLDAFKVERPSLMFVKLDDKMELVFHTRFEIPAKNLKK